MLVLGVYLTNSVRETQLENLRFHLEQEARIIAQASVPSLRGQSYSPDVLTRELSKNIDSRITIIAPDGKVLGDSVEDPVLMENHSTRPEIKDALVYGVGESIHYSTTLQQKMMYVAIPVYDQGELLGIARVSLPLTTVENSVSYVTRIIIFATGIVASLALIAAWLIARTVTRPVRQLTRAVQKITSGNLSQRVTPTTNDEIGQLSRAFNEMTSAFKTTMETIKTEQSKLANVLASMSDGVIMTDVEGEIVMSNPAAARIFGFTGTAPNNRQLIEIVRDHEIEEIFKKCLETSREQSVQFESSLSKSFLMASAIPLRKQSRLSGVLILVRDLTELRNLQTMRRELVGNISHELRTPLASIKAMTETLRSGAINDNEIAEDFLSRIEEEVDRLTQIVAELTQLSRIESGPAQLKKEAVDLNALIEEIILEMRPLADRQNITVFKDLYPNLPSLMIDKDRIRQAIINLVHNAIKFNRPGGKVTVSTSFYDGFISLSVSDTGIGISEKDLSHIFERFYKADKARSGGGSGLGLAITKHTVQAHGGEIHVQSEENKGSTFTLHLPLK